MLFNRKKKPDMVDIRELQKRGVVRIPRKEIIVPTNSDGFVELGDTKKPATGDRQPETVSNSDFFGFMDNSTQTTSNQESTTSFNDSPNGYNKREVDQKVSDLDNKIYKLEQRIELLEKKLDVNQSTNNVGAMGW